MSFAWNPPLTQPSENLKSIHSEVLKLERKITMEQAAFEVRSPDGHVWKVYEDGRIEGFPVGCVVFNRIPHIRAESWPTSKPADVGLAQG